MKLSLGFSPCPNDTFMFESLLFDNPLTDIEFDYKMEDVESLNQKAAEGVYEVTKISFAAFLKLTDKYEMLTSGAALGMGCGPLLISGEPIMVESLRDCVVAIPGTNTSANFLLNYALKFPFKTRSMSFEKIEDAVLEGEVDAGVIIHENRFTYQDKGLYLLEDLGATWETGTGKPIPLGGIAVKKDLAEAVKLKLNVALSQSVIKAQTRNNITDFIRQHAQELSDEVINQHIKLYVNKFSVDLGVDGKDAVMHMAEVAYLKGWIDKIPENIFVK